MSAADTINDLRQPGALSYKIFPDTGNDAAVKAWNRRMGTLAAIEMRCGGFYHAEQVSPKLAEEFDEIDEAFRFVRAETLQGILAKLWVALEYSLGPIRSEQERADHDSIRRGDTDEVAAFSRNFDFGPEILFGAILDIERALRFERVGSKDDSLVPPRKEAE